MITTRFKVLATYTHTQYIQTVYNTIIIKQFILQLEWHRVSDRGQFLKGQEGRLVVDIKGQAGQQRVLQNILAGSSLQHL